MKVPPKRKGNCSVCNPQRRGKICLNESPSEKEGKFRQDVLAVGHVDGLNESPSEKEGKYDAGEFTGDALKRLNESPSEKEGKFSAASATGRRWTPQ